RLRMACCGGKQAPAVRPASSIHYAGMPAARSSGSGPGSEAALVAFRRLRFLGVDLRFHLRDAGARHGFELAHADLADPGLHPDAVVPGQVLVRIPVALVVELRAVDRLVTVGSGHIDLHVAGEAGAAASDLAAL